MHDSLPTRQLLRNRGIIDIGLCPLCNYEEESTSHLFLLCLFAKACWHGLPLVVHIFDLIGISAQQWLRELIVSHNLDDEVLMEYMQNIFITLWITWTHRNMVVHEEKQPNQMEVILTVQNLYCKYKEAFSIHHGSISSCSRTRIEHNIVAGHWQLLIKVVGVRNSRFNRSAWAYEAKDLQGVIKLYGVANSNAGSTNGVV